MKRIISVILILVMVFSLCAIPANAEITSIETAEQYELWTQSPYLTSGLTREDVRIYKAMEMNMLHMYPLPKLGDNYYFAVAEGQMRNSGKNGRTDISLLYYYLLLETEDGFVIIDYHEPWSSYYWDNGHAIADVSESTVAPTRGSRVLYVINPKGKYDVSDWDDYNDYAFITDDKRMAFESADDEYSQGGCPVMYEGKMYWGKDRYVSGTSVRDYVLSGTSTYATQLQEMTFSTGNISFSSGPRVARTDLTSANGYRIFKDYSGDINEIKMYKIPNSEDVYFTLSNPYTYDETYGRSYYYDQFDIYKNINGQIKKVNSYLFSTKKASNTAMTITELGGIDKNYYDSEGHLTPAVQIQKTYIVTTNGQVIKVSLPSATYSAWNFSLYNNRLAVARTKNGSNYIIETVNGVSQYIQALNYVNIDEKGNFTLGADILLPWGGGNSGLNGYFNGGASYVECTTFKSLSTTPPKIWWNRFKDNVFDDGRTAEGEWYYVGNYSEMWYIIRKPDKTIQAIGPTGYTANSTMAEKELFFVAIGNSKFIMAVKDINSDLTKEYYRVAIVNETADGNVMPSVSIGNKTLTPPEDTDTVPVQNVIDFGKENLPIGYNIKDNVVSSEKLDSEVREQINTIRLNDIVIVKNTETASGVQNTGTTLDFFEEYDASMGVVPIVVHSNGQNFCWYSPEVDALTPGVYNKNYTVGDKVIYVTFKIVEAPDNKGTTTVVF